MNHMPGITLLIVACTLALPTSGWTSDEEEQKWDVSHPPMDRSRTVEIDVSAGTWMSLDVHPDGTIIAFDLLGDIYVLPINGGNAENISPGINWDMQPRFSPTGDRIAFISDRSGGDNVWVMESNGSDPVQVTDESFRLLNNPTWSPDGQTIAARKHFTTKRSLGAGEIWLYHISGGEGAPVKERPDKAFQKELGEPMFAPDGKSIYFTRNTSPGPIFEYAQNTHQKIFEIERADLQTGRTHKFLGAPGGSVRPTPSPDGRYLAFVRRIEGKSALFLKDLSSGAEKPLYLDLDQDMQETWAVQGVYPNMDWTPDSASIVFWARGKIHRFYLETAEVTEIPFHVKDNRTVFDPPQIKVEVTSDTVTAKMIRWATRSPSSNAVVFEAFGRLYLQDKANGAVELLTRDEAGHFELYPSFTPDGKWVIFTSWDDVNLGSLRKVKATGGRSKVLTENPGHYLDPVVSPDGEWIVFRRSSGGSLTSPSWSMEPGIYLMPLAGGEMRKLADTGADPHFSSDSQRVYIHQQKNEKHQLVSVDLRGSDQRQHAEGELTTQFRVSGDGMWLAFIENYEVFVTPMLKTGHSVAIGPKSKTARTVRVSASGGNYLNWTDGDTLTYSLGPKLFTVRTDDIFREEFKPPDSSRALDVTRPADTPTGSLALVGATVITMNADRQVIEDGVILITGNRITSVGKRGDIDIPGDSHQVDVTGKAITPGFIDAHAHGAYGTRGIIPQQSWVQYATLAFGVTTVHDPSSRSTHVFAASDYQRAGVVLAPRIFSTGEIVYGAKGELWAPVESLDDAVRHLQRLKAQGAYSVKNYNQPRRDQRQQVIQAARQLGMNVYAEGAALFHLDMSLIVDGNTGLEHTLPNQAVYEDVLEFWPQTRVGYTPTLVVGYGAVSGEDYWYQHTRVWKHPLLTRFVPPHVLQPRSIRRQMSPDADYAHFAIGRIGKQLADRGVSVHTGAHGQREGLATHWEMWMFVQAGMSPMQALQAATISPAGYLGYDHDLGSIETGKLADLVIMNSNPLADIRNSEDLDKVMLNGRLYDVRSLDEEITGSRKTREFYWWE